MIMMMMMMIHGEKSSFKMSNSKFSYVSYLNFDVHVLKHAYLLLIITYMWRSIRKGVLFETLDLKVLVQNVSELRRPSVSKSTPSPIERHICSPIKIAKKSYFKEQSAVDGKLEVFLKRLRQSLDTKCSWTSTSTYRNPPDTITTGYVSYVWWSAGKKHGLRRQHPS